MARKSDYFRSAALTLPQQIGRMSNTYPGFGGSFTRNGVSWTGQLQPSPISETYAVRIDYTLRKRPTVWVLQPNLRRRQADQKIPHTFHDGTVCLHLHEDWTPEMFVADTIVPWLALWLYYYEVWHGTGVWLGGGHEPRRGK